MVRIRYSLLILLALAIGVAGFFNPWLVIAGVVGLWTAIFLARNLEFGVLLLIFFFPFLGLVLDFSQFAIFRETPYLRGINAPFVDLYGLLLLVAWGLHGIFKYSNLTNLARQLPHFKSYLLFWLSGLISLVKVPAILLGSSAKYFLRPFSFFYLVFFAMPISILNNLKTKELSRVLMVFFWTGMLAAFNGFLGLLFGAHEEFPRAMPFAFWGVNPLGPNHNLLAETLIATAPVGLMLARYYSSSEGQQGFSTSSNNIPAGRSREVALVRYGMFFQWAMALLTFARTAWIAIALQGLLYYLLMRHSKRERRLEGSPRLPRGMGFLGASRFSMTLIGIGLAVVVFFVATTFSETVRGSTLSRLDQVRIAAFYFERSPWIGQGIGTFIPTLWQTRAFLLEYGDPLDAHGVLFKLAFEQGLFGLTAFGVFAGSILWTLIRGHRRAKGVKEAELALLTSLLIVVGSLTYQLFNTTYYTSKLWIPVAVAVAISHAYGKAQSQAVGVA